MREQSFKNANNSRPKDIRGGETKVMKKLLSSLIVLALVLSIVTPAFAAPASDVVGTQYEDAVAKLTALGVINGYNDGSFKPLNDITRAEFAKIIVVATGNESNAKFLAGTTAYSDVKGTEWYAGYVAAAQTLGLVKGYTDGTFRPANNITTQEVVTVLLRALGYNDELPGNWPYDYLVKANSLGLFAGLDITATAKATRGLVAQLTAGALEAEVVTFNAETKQFGGTGNYFVEFVNDGFYTAVVTAPGLDSQGRIELNDTPVAFADNAYVGDVELGQNVLLLVNADDEIIYLTSDYNKVVSGELNSTGKLVVGDKTYTPAGAIFYNNVDQSTSTAKLVEGVNVTLFLNTDDSVRFTVASGYDVKAGFIASTTETTRYQYVDYTTSGFYVNDNTVITLNGAAASFDDLAKGQVIYVSFEGGTGNTAVKVDAYDNVTSGKVTRVTSAGKYTINGVEYEIASGATVTLTLGKVYDVTLDANGKIVKAVEVTSSSTDTTFVGYYLSNKAYATLDADNAIVNVVDVKVATLDGQVKTYRADVTTAAAVTAEGYAKNGLYTFTVDKDGVLVLDKTEDGATTADAAAFALSTAAQKVVKDGVTATTLTLATEGKFNVTADTKVWKVVTNTTTGEYEVKVMSVLDLKENDEVKFVTKDFNFTHIFLTTVGTTTSALDPVYGFVVSKSVEDVLVNDKTETNTYVTLNVNGSDVTYKVANGTVLTSAAVGTFGSLTEATTAVDGVYDVFTPQSLADVTTFTLASGNVFSINGSEYVYVAGTTKVLVKTVDTTKTPNVTTYELGAYFNIQDAKYDLDLTSSEYTYKTYVKASSTLFGGKTVADIVVIERTK